MSETRLLANGIEPMRDSAKAMLAENAITLGYRVSFLANYLMGPIYSAIQAELGFNRAEAAILFCLRHQEPLSGIEIAEMTGRPRNSISPAVRKLHRAGLISKANAARNRKIEHLSLTERGSEAAARIVPYFVQWEQAMLAPFDEADRALLAQLLARLIQREDGWLDDSG